MSATDLDALEPPERSDFRRIGRQKVPMVLNPVTGKHERYRRSSSAGKILDDDSGLWDWKQRTQLVGAARRPDLMALVSVLDPEAAKKEIRDIGEQCLEVGKGADRAIQGQAVHSMFDHLDLGHEWEPAPQFAAICLAYVNTLEAWGLEPIDVEVHCVNDHYRLAGTLDRRYRLRRALVAPDGTVIPIGSVLVGDTKTGRTLEYASGAYSTQLTTYALSVRYNVITDEREPFNPPNCTDWALVLHAVPEDESVTVYWVDLAAGLEGLELATQVYGWRRRTGLLLPGRPPLHSVPSEASQSPLGASEGADPPGTALPSPDDLRAFLRARVLDVKAHSDAAFMQLQKLWPTGMPKLSSDGQTQEQLEQVIDALSTVEQEWAICYRPYLFLRWFHELGHSGPLVEPLKQLANLDAAKWDDESLSLMLLGTIRALGYEHLSEVPDREVTNLLSAVFAITTGTAMLMYDDNERPVVRFNVREAR